jgi:hypothetical protein
MELNSAQAVLWAFLFLLPGFVWSAVYAMLIPRRTDTAHIRFMEFFTLSSVNNAFWSWLIYLSYVKRVYVNHPVAEAALAFMIVFASPVAAALLTAKFKQHGWSARFVDWLGFNTALQITTAWEFKLSNTPPTWIAVGLKNGERILGLFGADSFAGDASATTDLYLEKTIRLSNGGNSSGEASSQGIWIAADQIATIEFTETSNGDDKSHRPVVSD